MSYLAAIAAVLTIRLERPERVKPHANFTLREVLGGLHYLKHDRRIASIFGIVTFFGVVGMGYDAMIPAYTQRVVKAGVSGYSILLSCGGIGATLGAVFVASLGKQRRKDRWVSIGMLIFAVSLAGGGDDPDVAGFGRHKPGPAGGGGRLLCSARASVPSCSTPRRRRSSSSIRPIISAAGSWASG